MSTSSPKSTPTSLISPTNASASSATRSDRISVLVRTRPTTTPASEITSPAPRTLSVNIGRQGSGVEGGVNNQTSQWQFEYDELLTQDVTQAQVYSIGAADIVDSVMNGMNGTLIAYGQTGAGKTYTMSGQSMSYENRGIIPRAISHIFREIQQKQENSYKVFVSYVEIYNEHLFDLLAEEKNGSSSTAGSSNSRSTPTDLSIQEDISTGSIHVRGLNKRYVTSEQECYDALFQGEQVRSIGEHVLNQQSTRSHCIYTIYLEQRSRIESSEKVLLSKLNLVDLAGSERIGKSHSSGILLSEAKYINKSLTFLEQVVVALTQSKREHVPYRQSKLTQLLKDSLGGNTKTRVICNIHIDRPNIEETISTLKFGQRMKKVQNRISVNIALDPLLHVSKLQKEIRELKQELMMHDTLVHRVGVSYEPFSQEETKELKKKVETYVASTSDEIEIVNLRQVREIFKLFKGMLLEQQRVGVRPQSGNKRISALRQKSTGGSDPAAALSTSDATMVGDLASDGGGFNLGQVSSDRKPASRPDSRDEPLKPKNIIRARARVPGSSTQQSTDANTNDQQFSSVQSTGADNQSGDAEARAYLEAFAQTKGRIRATAAPRRPQIGQAFK